MDTPHFRVKWCFNPWPSKCSLRCSQGFVHSWKRREKKRIIKKKKTLANHNSTSNQTKKNGLNVDWTFSSMNYRGIKIYKSKLSSSNLSARSWVLAKNRGASLKKKLNVEFFFISNQSLTQINIQYIKLPLNIFLNIYFCNIFYSKIFAHSLNQVQYTNLNSQIMRSYQQN